jgi:hypothetical protein
MSGLLGKARACLRFTNRHTLFFEAVQAFISLIIFEMYVPACG